ncbi:MAG: MBL fold metallo-hydrolase [Firmicutes bacterium]|nr:MBL fold metallo-hydrolase [Bacillota bacterium]
MGNQSNESAQITWFGHSMFLIEDNRGIRIITDPYQEYTGYTPPKISADIVTISHHHRDHNNISTINGSPEVIDSIGKFNIKGILIEGIPSFHDEVRGKKRGENIIFKYNVGGITLAHMGDFGQPITDEQVGALLGVDVLMIPVGGVYTIDGKEAARVVKIIKPKIAIPIHYKTAHCAFEIDTAEPFLEEMDVVKRKGSTIELSAANIPRNTEAWIMEYVQ